MIQAHGRRKLNQEDLRFVVTTLGRPGEKETTLLQLLADPDTRDAILDHPVLFARLQEKGPTPPISLFLYFYLLCRQALREHGIDDRATTDYLASLLAEFARGNRAYRVHAQSQKEYQYLVDLMNDMLSASTEEEFYLRSHLGDYALFLTGIFPAFIYHRAKYHPPSPDFSYYEQVGSSNYHLAAQHAMAERYRLSGILELLGREFRRVRLALNHLADNYLQLDRNPGATDKVMRRLDHFIEQRRGN
ncbi:MAG: hypothetical protein ONB48_08875 [candidate division KSB1 bacterium]|nr:hypothetical protein [candidate division KSB1 bacterium]MDZ7275959.1 hypothetical protein [candidate division KSB1 bacterium]MDZ7285759.1 hypothetical protein [candidate division KSB1 bacterium]MDZ7298791.1 hypothetical protein [candidate division KSB1 bacterium]MDZ7307919.1 hypothetical protein [candidate division KSB1 bacterium]